MNKFKNCAKTGDQIYASFLMCITLKHVPTLGPSYKTEKMKKHEKKEHKEFRSMIARSFLSNQFYQIK